MCVYYCHTDHDDREQWPLVLLWPFRPVHLPYYKADIEAGRLTIDQALELIALFFIKMNSLNKVRPWDHTEFGVATRCIPT
jgi:formate C-acetyltransferase